VHPASHRDNHEIPGAACPDAPGSTDERWYVLPRWALDQCF